MNRTHSILKWIDQKRIESELKVTPLTLDNTKLWSLQNKVIEHQTKRYFSIKGIEARFENSSKKVISQPIIYQPEIGLLGFIICQNRQEVEILIQAKTEPGNINGTQLAPTVQATYSNYTQVHNGEPTKYLNYFLEKGADKAIGTLQSEQGTRFLGKYNMNVTVVLKNKDIDESKDLNWLWVPLKELLCLLDEDFLINTDARSVLVCSDWTILSGGNKPFEHHQEHGDFGQKLHNSFISNTKDAFLTTEVILNNLSESRIRNEFCISDCDLTNISGWTISQEEISKEDFFSIKYFNVSVKGREVPEWSQPLIQTKLEYNVILYCQELNGVLHFLLSHSCEIGFTEFVQFGPSQYSISEAIPTFKFDLTDNQLTTIAKYRQSDEGGRFYHSVINYSLKEIDVNFPITVDNNEYSWMTLKQVYELLPIKGTFNNEFRSVLSLILKYI